jgi:hypothetical protein
LANSAAKAAPIPPEAPVIKAVGMKLIRIFYLGFIYFNNYLELRINTKETGFFTLLDLLQKC